MLGPRTKLDFVIYGWGKTDVVVVVGRVTSSIRATPVGFSATSQTKVSASILGDIASFSTVLFVATEYFRVDLGLLPKFTYT